MDRKKEKKLKRQIPQKSQALALEKVLLRQVKTSHKTGEDIRNTEDNVKAQHMTNCSASLTREAQIKTILWYHHQPTRTIKI